MNKELVDIQDLKSAFISHCKELGCDENYIKVCENKFSNIEIALKKIESPLTKEYLTYENKELRGHIDRLIIEHKALEIIKELFDFDFAIRFGNNQSMLMIINKRTNEYWELPISKDKYDLLKEILL